MEAYNYPFYGTQFHPEKNVWTFIPDKKIDHTEEGELISRKYFDFFVNKARKNMNAFESYDDEVENLVENYNIIVTDKYEGSVYVFKPAKSSPFLQ